MGFLDDAVILTALLAVCSYVIRHVWRLMAKLRKRQTALESEFIHLNEIVILKLDNMETNATKRFDTIDELHTNHLAHHQKRLEPDIATTKADIENIKTNVSLIMKKIITDE